MSARGKRGRGRGRGQRSGNPLTIRKPRSVAPSEAGSRSSTPLSTPSSKSRVSQRLRGKNRPRDGIPAQSHYASSIPHNHDIEMLSDSEADSINSLSPFDDDFKTLSDDSWSEDETNKDRTFTRRWPSPEIPEVDEDTPTLEIPSTSTDLVIPPNILMQCLGVYEVLRKFCKLLRISPFLFEDFCAALVTEEQCVMLTEIHCQLLRAILREEDANNTIFSAPDLKDSVNISLFFLDAMTFSECVRAYLDGDKSPEFRAALPAFEKGSYCSTSLEERLSILQTLTDLYLSSNAVREDLLSEGNIHYDDHCRNCHRLVWKITSFLKALLYRVLISVVYFLD